MCAWQILNSIAIPQWAVVNGTCFYCSNNFNDFPSSIITLFELYCCNVAQRFALPMPRCNLRQHVATCDKFGLSIKCSASCRLVVNNWFVIMEGDRCCCFLVRNATQHCVLSSKFYSLFYGRDRRRFEPSLANLLRAVLPPSNLPL